jgi:hypothetical protein
MAAPLELPDVLVLLLEVGKEAGVDTLPEEAGPGTMSVVPVDEPVGIS